MSFYWEEYTDPSGMNKEEGAVARQNRMDANIGRAFGDISSEISEHKQTLHDIKTELSSIDDSLRSIAERMGTLVQLAHSLTSSEQGNILERAYMLAVMQERQETQQQLEELRSLAATLKSASNEEEVRQALEGTQSAEPS